MARAFSVKEFVGKQHHQGCITCRRRYVCACQTPEIDGQCPSCRMGRTSVSAWVWDPKPCCLAAQPIKPMHSEQRRSHKLAGSGPWFKCPTCARTFPCQPGQVKTA